jgi:hypothetical protein
MMHINRFMDKMTVADGKQSKDLVLPMTDARGLRDDIIRLLSDLHEMSKNKNQDEVLQVEIRGGSFK